mmetsp:Transcript_33679/g.66243  ORF Transcript_33679/g.66243 Transcript_33679/m.66243 type:complete len:89 (+) Transcript_33679:1117-1383(+)
MGKKVGWKYALGTVTKTLIACQGWHVFSEVAQHLYLVALEKGKQTGTTAMTKQKAEIVHEKTAAALPLFPCTPYEAWELRTLATRVRV